MTDVLEERKTRKRERARRSLLEVARAVVRERGVRGLTIAAVAERADVSKPAVHYYFASKEALIRQLALDDAHAEHDAVMQAIERAADGPGVLRDFIRAFVEHYADDLEMFRVSYVWGQVVGLDPDLVDAQINPDMVALFTRLTQRLDAERVAGRLRPDIHTRRLAVVAWTSALGIVSTLSVCDAAGQRLLHAPSDLVDALSDALIRGAFVDPR
jgi:TetR/AcrR family transcriptional regulator